ncbi:MAG TPA: uracil-DNA glycosylase [Candidatus Omnitrophota bacterium]|nr:uracil-DNA glycosylase [Candidatus Omnitrophota bacterium]
MSSTDPLQFLKALKEDGVEQLYLPKDGGKGRAVGGKQKKEAVASSTLSPSLSDAKDAVWVLRDEVLKCKKCKELASTRTKIVFGAGNIRARLVFVGEAPGADEDKQGLPFVGRAGQLLTKIIEAMGLTREQVFICNVLKCRPPNNRPPAPDEVGHCRPFLKRQLELIRPSVIVALGNHACQALLGTDKGISQLRGSFQEYEGIPVMCTYHPAYLLRSPGEKGKVWEDMKKVIQKLDPSDE